MMAIDLRHCGYRRRDVLRIYGFNLILLPVNLSGTVASMVQLLIGEKACVQAHAEGAQPHHAGLHVRRHALRVRRLLGGGSDQRRLPRSLGQRGAGRSSTPRSPATRSSPTSASATRSSTSSTTSSAGCTSRSARRGPSAPHPARPVPITVADAPAAHWSQTLAYASADGVRRAERRRSSHRDGVPGDRRSPLGDRRAAVRAPDEHDRQDTIAAHTPAPESRDQR